MGNKSVIISSDIEIEQLLDSLGTIENQAQAKEIAAEIRQRLRNTVEPRTTTRQSLIQPECKFKALVENAPSVIARFDRQLRFLYVNPAVEPATGLPPQSFIGKTSREVGMPTPSCDLWEAKFQEVFTTQREIQFEFDFDSPTGKRHYHSRLVPEFAADGSVETIMGIAYDITERKQAEEVMWTHQEQLRLFVEYAPAAVAMLDRDMRYLLASRRWLTDYGLGNRNIIGRSHYEVFPEISERWKEIHRRCLAGASESNEEDYFLRADGTLDWVRWQIHPWHDRQGNIGGIIMFTEMITEEKRAQEYLHRERLFLRQVIDTVPGLIFVKDWDGHFILGNQALADAYGTTVQAIVGKTDADFNDNPEELRHFQHDDREVMSAKHQKVIPEEKVTFADGWEHWMSTVKIPLTNEDGTCDRVLGVATDITQRKQVEEIARKAKESAEAANKAKDQFLAVLSHELRTPLTPILTTAQLMETDSALPHEYYELVKMIRRNAELEARLIDDLLDLTRISRGKLELHLAPVDLHEEIRQVIEICNSDIRSKRLRLILELHALHHYVQADAARLQQVIWNLLKNAVKFTPPEGEIILCTENPSPDRLSLSVKDTGIGIESDTLALLFNAFEQGSRKMTRQFGGLGLGLAISKSLVDMHGGTLTAQSEGVGKGSAFTMELAALPVGKISSPRIPSSKDETAAEGGKYILLVEDHPDTAKTLNRLLKSYGYRVRIADSIASALQASQAENFDLVVSDIGLPDGSGLDLMRQLRLTHPIKGIALSGYGMEEDIRRSKEAGFIAHLTKPVNLAELKSTLTQILHPLITP